MKLRVYDNTGKERWVAVNAVIPAGWYNEDCEVLNKPHVVKFEKYPNLTLENAANKYTLILEELQ